MVLGVSRFFLDPFEVKLWFGYSKRLLELRDELTAEQSLGFFAVLPWWVTPGQKTHLFCFQADILLNVFTIYYL